MAEQVVIQELVTRLIGDAEQFQRTLDEAIARVKEFGNTVTSIMATVSEVIGFRGAVSSFTNFQDNLVRIESALKANGMAVDETMDKYRQFAREIESSTRISEMQTLSLLGTAAAFNLTGEKAQQAARTAIAISQMRPGYSPEMIMQSLSMFMDAQNRQGGAGRGGGGRGVYRLAYMLGITPQMGGGREGAAEAHADLIEKINKRLEIANEVATKFGQNFGGQLARITNFLTDLRVEIGSILAQWLEPFVKWLGDAVRWLKELDPNIKKIAVALMGLATVLVSGGPIMTFFMFLMRLATNISPITVAITALVGVTAVWIKYVGGVAESWNIVLESVRTAVTLGVNWLTEFIATHQRLVLAIGLVAGVIITAVVAYRLLATALNMVNAVLVLLHVRQILVFTTTLVWNAALLAVRMALMTVSAVLGAAGLLTNLILTTAQIIAQITLWAVFRGTVLLWNAAAAMTSAIFSGLGYALVALKAALVAGVFVLTGFTLAIKTLHVALNLIGVAFFGLSTMLSVLSLTPTVLVTATRAFVRMIGVFITSLSSLWSTVTTTASAIVTMLSSLAAAVSIQTLTTIVLFGVAAWTLYSGAVWASNLALAAITGVATGVTTAFSILSAGIGTIASLFATAFFTAVTAGKAALSGFLDVLLSIPVRTGALAEIGNLFREWFGYIMDVYQAMKLSNSAIEETKNRLKDVGDTLKGVASGMDLAWEIGKTGFQIMVREIQLSWPPLFDFIKVVAQSAWDTLKDGWKAFVTSIVPPFKLAFTNLIAYLKEAFYALFAEVFASLRTETLSDNPLILPLQTSLNSLADQMEGTMKRLGQRVRGITREEALNVADRIEQLLGDINVERALGGFDDLIKKKEEEVARLTEKLSTYKGTTYKGMADDVKNAANAMNDLNNKIKEREKLIADAAAKSGANIMEKLGGDQELKKLKEQYGGLQDFLNTALTVQKEQEQGRQKLDLGAPFEQATKEIKKWEAALFGSSEAYQHWFEYMDRLNEWESKKGSLSPYTANRGREGASEPNAPPLPAAPHPLGAGPAAPHAPAAANPVVANAGAGGGAGAGHGGGGATTAMGFDKAEWLEMFATLATWINKEIRKPQNNPLPVAIANVKAGGKLPI